MSSSQPGKGLPIPFYLGVLLVAAGSVLFGLDWVNAPLPPMPETEASVQAAKVAAQLPPPRAIVVKAAPVQVRIVQPGVPQSAQAGPAVAVLPPQVAPAGPAVIAAPAAPKCDVAACAAAYRSFREADCTWQPYDGPRRFCDKGDPPQDTAQAGQPGAAPGAILAPETGTDQTNPKCNVEACRQAYFTFNPADCTYQPSNGPRKLCAK